GNRVAKKVPVSYVFQELSNIPEGFSIPEGRQKPWGTGHAILSCLGIVNEPFVAINADDFYGRNAFALAAEFLKTAKKDEDKAHYMMVGYRLENTLTENGSVARGVCETDNEGHLLHVQERSKIMRKGDGAAYTEDDGETWIPIPLGETVSMNMWGFTPDFLEELDARFASFLEENLPKNPIKCEYFLPFVVDAMISEGKADVKVLTTTDMWFGVTYKEDKPMVVENIRAMEEAGVYPKEF
ncbi:MAG: nucleotidyltransferase, partial [Blautia sp.]|nr:nucleotidyltransferase [Blautia sp.]